MLKQEIKSHFYNLLKTAFFEWITDLVNKDTLAKQQQKAAKRGEANKNASTTASPTPSPQAAKPQPAAASPVATRTDLKVAVAAQQQKEKPASVATAEPSAYDRYRAAKAEKYRQDARKTGSSEVATLGELREPPAPAGPMNYEEYRAAKAAARRKAAAEAEAMRPPAPSRTQYYGRDI